MLFIFQQFQIHKKIYRKMTWYSAINTWVRIAKYLYIHTNEENPLQFVWKNLLYMLFLKMYIVLFCNGYYGMLSTNQLRTPRFKSWKPKIYIKFSDAYHNVNLFSSLLKVNYSLLLSTIYVNHLQSTIHYPKSVFWSVIKIFKH